MQQKLGKSLYSIRICHDNRGKSIGRGEPAYFDGRRFSKIIVRNDVRKRWYDDKGILNIGVIEFLLDDTLL